MTDLRRRQRFGLVYEAHVPETTAILGLPIQVGALVRRRQIELIIVRGDEVIRRIDLTDEAKREMVLAVSPSFAAQPQIWPINADFGAILASFNSR